MNLLANLMEFACIAVKLTSHKQKFVISALDRRFPPLKTLEEQVTFVNNLQQGEIFLPGVFQRERR